MVTSISTSFLPSALGVKADGTYTAGLSNTSTATVSITGQSVGDEMVTVYSWFCDNVTNGLGAKGLLKPKEGFHT